MHLAAVCLVALKLVTPGNEDGKGPLLPIPYYFPVPPVAIVEQDEDIQDLMDDLEEYKYRLWHGEIPLQFGARKKHVLRYMGAPDVRSGPDGVGRDVWWYGKSFIVFKERTVIAWQQNDTELPFGLQVAPRDYLPRTAYRDPGPAQGTPIPLLRPEAGGQGGAAAGGLSVTDRARNTYILALKALETNPSDGNAQQAAQRAGESYFRLLRPDGYLTDDDKNAISNDIAAAILRGTPK